MAITTGQIPHTRQVTTQYFQGSFSYTATDRNNTKKSIPFLDLSNTRAKEIFSTVNNYSHRSSSVYKDVLYRIWNAFKSVLPFFESDWQKVERLLGEGQLEKLCRIEKGYSNMVSGRSITVNRLQESTFTYLITDLAIDKNQVFELAPTIIEYSYQPNSLIEYVSSAISNSVKSLFGRSKWQDASKLLKGKISSMTGDKILEKAIKLQKGIEVLPKKQVASDWQKV